MNKEKIQSDINSLETSIRISVRNLEEKRKQLEVIEKKNFDLLPLCEKYVKCGVMIKFNFTNIRFMTQEMPTVSILQVLKEISPHITSYLLYTDNGGHEFDIHGNLTEKFTKYETVQVP